MSGKWMFGELTKAEWGKFEAAWPGAHFFQSAQNIEMRELMGDENFMLGVREGKKIVAGGVLLGRRGEFWIAYGPLIDWADRSLVEFFLSGLVDFARARNMLKIEVFPDVLLSLRDSRGEITKEWNWDGLMRMFAEAGFRYEGKTVNMEMKAGRWAFVKDLSGIKDVDGLRATYRKTLRARLRQTEGQVKIETLKRSELGKLVGLIDESDARNGIKGREMDFYRAMFDAYGQDVEFLIAVKSDDGTPIAGAIFVYHGKEVASFLSGMDRRYRDLNGRAWLQDYVMQKCLRRGIARVNFFWIEGKFENNHLLEFKSGFGGGVVEEYIGGFMKVLRPTGYFGRRVARKSRSLIRRIHGKA